MASTLIPRLAREAGKSRLLRRVLRSVFDLAAVVLALSVQYAASGSASAAIVNAVLIGLYGFWCFYDGITSAQAIREQFKEQP